METVILNNFGLGMSDAVEAKLLWSTIMLVEHIHFSGMLSLFIDSDDFLNSLPERQRLIVIDMFLKHFTRNREESVMKEIKETNIGDKYKELIEFRKKKHKTKQEIIIIKATEKILVKYKEIYDVFVKNIIEKNNLRELKPFLRAVDGKNPVIINIIGIPFNTDILKHNSAVSFLMEIMITREVFPLLSENIESVMEFKGELLCRFPSPETLKYNQIQIIRNELADALFGGFEKIIALNDILNERNNEEIVNECVSAVREIGNSLQPVIDKNVYIESLKNQSDNVAYYNLYIGIASVENILDFYQKSGGINPNLIIYTRDKLREESDLNYQKLFLYLKVE